MELLWGKLEQGTASELSRLCGVSFAAAYSELELLKAAGLLEVTYQGNQAVYAANQEHEKYGVLRELVTPERSELSEDKSGRELSQEEHDQSVRVWLKEIGAPLLVEERSQLALPSLEKILAEAVRLAHRDGTVARILPVCFWLNRERLNFGRLEVEARRLGETQALGFFLNLTGELSGDKALCEFGGRFVDRRRKRVKDFFDGANSKYNQALSEMNTPELARRWHFRLNIAFDSFRAAFDCFALQT